MSGFRNYCLECGWELSVDDGYSKRDIGRKAVEHHMESGHAIGGSRSGSIEGDPQRFGNARTPVRSQFRADR